MISAILQFPFDKDAQKAVCEKVTNYIKFYPANGNTHMFIASDVSYSKDDNVATEFFKKYNMEYSRIKDKAARDEYENDFITYARTGALDGFFVFPDCFKPLKTGMSKINDKISKSSKKDSTIPYSVDTSAIKVSVGVLRRLRL